LALLLGARLYSSAAYLLLNIALTPFSPTTVCAAQILIALEIVAFARKIVAENYEKMKQPVSSGSTAAGTIKEKDGLAFSTWSMLRAEGSPT
jgi:hypothetical protein